MSEKAIPLTYVGMDSWSRPVYEDPDGRLWKDTDPRSHVPASLYSACNNALDGEPDCPWPFRKPFKLLPKRRTW